MTTTSTAAQVAASLVGRLPEGFTPKLFIICGSGLGGLADTIEEPIAIKYGDIEGFPSTTVAGHKGELVFGKLSGMQVVCMRGRFHSYEGHDMQMCTFPVRVGAHLGVETLVVTNAAGGLNRSFKVGDVMVMSDHLFIPGMAGRNPLVGLNDPGPDGSWPRFPPMSDAYDPELAELAFACGAAEGLSEFMHPKGTYAMVSGPNYETAAECRFLHGAGADAVGMSTAPECIVARHCGMKVLGFSLITNVAVLHPGDGPPANHAEVLEATEMRAAQLQGLVRRIVGSIHSGVPPPAPAAAAAGGEGGGLLCVGSLNADIIVEVDRFPQRGETIGSRNPNTGFMLPGGKGANQAVAAARLSAASGGVTRFACVFGNDGNATALRKVLEENKLDLSLCSTCDKPSGQAFIFLEADGSNSIIIVGASNLAWPQQLDAGLAAAVASASAVMLQREIPDHVNEAVARAAKAAGVPVILDMGGVDAPLPESLLPLLSLVCPNETELARLTAEGSADGVAMPTETQEQCVAAAKTVQARGVSQVLVTRGSHGAVLLGADGSITARAANMVEKVVDTTGAGDCFRAAYAVAFTEGRPTAECLDFAAKAAALCVGRLGAIPSMPNRSEIV